MNNSSTTVDVFDFKTFYPYSQFIQADLAYAEYVTAKKLKDSDLQSKIDAWFHQFNILDQAILQKIKAMGKSGHLSPCLYADGRGLFWPNAWNQFARGLDFTESWLQDRQNYFTAGIALCLVPKHASNDIERLEIYEQLVSRINAGNFPLKHDHEQCELTGLYFHMEFKEWKPSLFEFKRNPSGKLSKFFLDQDAPKLEPFYAEIPTPSGRLLVSDWFRIEEFTDLVDPKETKYTHPSVNLLYGRVQQTQRYAQLGFLSVSVGNTCPRIFMDQGVLIVGHLDHNLPRSLQTPLSNSDKGYVCTDLWQATLIDEDILIGLLSTKMDLKTAQKTVADYISNNHVTVLDWPKGKPLHVTFLDHGLHDFHCEQINDRVFNTIYFSAAENPMSWFLSPQRKLKL